MKSPTEVAYQAAFVYAAKKIDEKEKAGLFFETPVGHSQREEIQHCLGKLNNVTTLRIMGLGEKNQTQTDSYTLAKEKKASDAIVELIDGAKSGCAMTCQMAAQLAMYYALYKTLGADLFDKVFTDISPLILRDYTVFAGQPFIQQAPFTGQRGDRMTGVAPHPLAMFIDINPRRGKGPVQVGDTMNFTNFLDYDAVRASARVQNGKGIEHMMRRMEMLCIAQDTSGNPLYYSFLSHSPKTQLTTLDAADMLVAAYNKNLKMVTPNATPKTREDLLKTAHFEDWGYHNVPAYTLIDFLRREPQDALKEIRAYHDAIAAERKIVDKLPANTVPLREEMMLKLLGIAENALRDKKIELAISAATGMAAETLRAFDQDPKHGRMAASASSVDTLANTYALLASIYAEKDAKLLALRYAELAVSVCYYAGVPSSDDMQADLVKAKTQLSGASGSSNTQCRV